MTQYKDDQQPEAPDRFNRRSGTQHDYVVPLAIIALLGGIILPATSSYLRTLRSQNISVVMPPALQGADLTQMTADDVAKTLGVSANAPEDLLFNAELTHKKDGELKTVLVPITVADFDAFKNTDISKIDLSDQLRELQKLLDQDKPPQPASAIATAALRRKNNPTPPSR